MPGDFARQYCMLLTAELQAHKRWPWAQGSKGVHQAVLCGACTNQQHDIQSALALSIIVTALLVHI